MKGGGEKNTPPFSATSEKPHKIKDESVKVSHGCFVRRMKRTGCACVESDNSEMESSPKNTYKNGNHDGMCVCLRGKGTARAEQNQKMMACFF